MRCDDDCEEEEIRCQFHQCSTYSFYARRSQKRKKILMTWLSFYAFGISMSAKAVRKTLMKLTPGVDFTDIFTRSFCASRSRKHEKTDDLTALLMLLGYVHVKAVHRMLKLSPGIYFLNMFMNSFYLCRSQKPKDSQVSSVFLRFLDLHAQKLLVKCWWN